MPLNNVWTIDSNGEWVRTDAKTIDRESKYSISVNSHRFRCYSCFQYVTFIKGDERASHFKHSRGEEDKNCEDRSANFNYKSVSIFNTDMPMRIVKDGMQLSFEIGFLPAKLNELQRCEENNFTITLTGSRGLKDVYRVDRGRFAPGMTTWLPVRASDIAKLRISFSPTDIKPKIWSGLIPAVHETGALFDAETGRRIPDKGDALVNHEYYLLIGLNRVISISRQDIRIEHVKIQTSYWSVYKIVAPALTRSAADFFFEHLHVRLTGHPVEMDVLWPPVLEMDNIIETNRQSIKLMLQGEADLATYPPHEGYPETALPNGMKLIDVQFVKGLQMISSERYGQTLQFLYIRPIERSISCSYPQVKICYDDGQTCDETRLSKIPPHGILTFQSTDDGHIDVYERGAFAYRKLLPADDLTRIIDIRTDSEIQVFAGLELLKVINVIRQRNEINSGLCGNLPAWREPKVPFPRKYAWVLSKMNEESELYQRTVSALQQGEIARDGWNTIRRIMEDCCDG